MKIRIAKGIQVPVFDVEMLQLGKLIAVPFKQHLQQGESLWLYPSHQLPLDLKLDEYYKPEYLGAAREATLKCASLPLTINTWGVCEFHWQIYPNRKHLLSDIAQFTIWNFSALEKIFKQNQVLKLLFLRVYCLSKPCIVKEPKKPGLFFWFDSEDEVTSATEKDLPIVSKSSFNQRKTLMMAGIAYPYKALEALQIQTKGYGDSRELVVFDQSIRRALGWLSEGVSLLDSPAWMDTITMLGDRSMETEGTSNYQAGTDFEIAVRKSLEFLGFKVDYSHKGGAGGVDIFCSDPYPLIGECKSGKKIPNETAVQLLNLGTIHLSDKETFNRSVKLIIGPGTPTDQLKKAAVVHGMSIINPSTLEKLVKLHYQYPIDLFKLKDFLIDGQADEEVERYIAETWQSIKVRAHVIGLVRQFLENTGTDEDADISELFAAYVMSIPPQALKREEMYEILIELSSPLNRYLGRRRSADGIDRFYYLRDLLVE